MTMLRVTLLLVLLCSLSGCIRDSASGEDRRAAIAAALDVYEQQKQAGIDFSNGPCLAEEVIDDWSADIAHDPREEVDNQPENQCQAYRDGRTHHFVELTPEGELIRAR
jgi:hypothetical protein